MRDISFPVVVPLACNRAERLKRSPAAAKVELPGHVFVASDILAAHRKNYALPASAERAANNVRRTLSGKKRFVR